MLQSIVENMENRKKAWNVVILFTIPSSSSTDNQQFKQFKVKFLLNVFLQASKNKFFESEDTTLLKT